MRSLSGSFQLSCNLTSLEDSLMAGFDHSASFLLFFFSFFFVFPFFCAKRAPRGLILFFRRIRAFLFLNGGPLSCRRLHQVFPQVPLRHLLAAGFYPACFAHGFLSAHAPVPLDGRFSFGSAGASPFDDGLAKEHSPSPFAANVSREHSLF